jgi:glutamate synthase domain-containing protein 3
MSGGVIFALDLSAGSVNGEWARLEQTLDDSEEAWLRSAITQHLQLTGSARAKSLLRKWSASRRLFRRVLPSAEGALSQPAITRAGIPA